MNRTSKNYTKEQFNQKCNLNNFITSTDTPDSSLLETVKFQITERKEILEFKIDYNNKLHYVVYNNVLYCFEKKNKYFKNVYMYKCFTKECNCFIIVEIIDANNCCWKTEGKHSSDNDNFYLTKKEVIQQNELKKDELTESKDKEKKEDKIRIYLKGVAGETMDISEIAEEQAYLVCTSTGYYNILICRNHVYNYKRNTQSSFVYYCSGCKKNTNESYKAEVFFDSDGKIINVDIDHIPQHICSFENQDNQDLLKMKVKQFTRTKETEEHVRINPQSNKHEKKQLIENSEFIDKNYLKNALYYQKQKLNLPKNIFELFCYEKFNYIISDNSNTNCILFYREWSYDLLSYSNTLIIDGSFTIIFNPFVQIVVISAMVDNIYFNCLFILLRGKRKKDYKLMIDLIEENGRNLKKPPVFGNPKTVLIDNEAGFNRVFEKIPGVEITLCDFHTKQAWRRKLWECGFPKKDNVTKNYNEFIKKNSLNKLIKECKKLEQSDCLLNEEIKKTKKDKKQKKEMKDNTNSSLNRNTINNDNQFFVNQQQSQLTTSNTYQSNSNPINYDNNINNTVQFGSNPFNTFDQSYYNNYSTNHSFNPVQNYPREMIYPIPTSCCFDYQPKRYPQFCPIDRMNRNQYLMNEYDQIQSRNFNQFNNYNNNQFSVNVYCQYYNDNNGMSRMNNDSKCDGYQNEMMNRTMNRICRNEMKEHKQKQMEEEFEVIEIKEKNIENNNHLLEIDSIEKDEISDLQMKKEKSVH